MAKECPEWNRFESARGEMRFPETNRRPWQEHLWRCAACRREWNARGEIVRLVSGIEPPRLAPGFTERLGAQLEAEPAAKLDARGRRWLRIYWVLAGLTSLWIVLRAGTEWSSSSWLRHGLFTLALALPFVELIPARKVRRWAAGLSSILPE